MQLVEQHIISRDDPRFAKLDAEAFASKNLWNAANYVVRRSFIFEHIYLDNVKVFHLIKSHEAYQALPRKVGNQVLFSGRRDGRWYRVKGRPPIHSDVNGSYNIGRKVFPTAFDGLGIEALAVRPRQLAV